jgi:hypothetical protein
MCSRTPGVRVLRFEDHWLWRPKVAQVATSHLSSMRLATLRTEAAGLNTESFGWVGERYISPAVCHNNEKGTIFGRR